MNHLFYLFLFLFGTLFGSFASVIIYRLKKKEKWILLWRSHCAKCNTLLNTLDLIPIVSWTVNKWKCAYCKDKISCIYPLLEISMWILFFLIWYYLIDFNLILMFDKTEVFKLIFWLVIWFISVVYSFYDILFLEIHDWIMLFAIIFVLLTMGLQTIFPSFDIIPTLSTWVNSMSVNLSSILLSFIIVWMLYIIMFKWLKEIWDISILITTILLLYVFKKFFDINLWDITILNWVAWMLGIFIFFFLQILVSWGAWLWWWDLRIAILIWLMLWITFAFPWTMIVYLVWSIIGVSFVLSSKLKNGFKKKFDTIIPFWPFLAIWFFVTIFLKNDILKFIEIYFSNM